MKERPILFSAPMVRAILAGQKTMTRRVMKVQPYESEYEPGQFHMTYRNNKRHLISATGSKEMLIAHCPHGQKGDRLYVRESARVINVRGGSREIDIEYQADKVFKTVPYPARLAPAPKGKLLANGTYREASRILLEITEVRVARLQDISEEDALDEGIREETNIIVGASCAGGRHHEITGDRYFYDGGFEEGYEAPIIAFRELWESINGPDSWEANPCVWVVCFGRIA